MPFTTREQYLLAGTLSGGEQSIQGVIAEYEAQHGAIDGRHANGLVMQFVADGEVRERVNGGGDKAYELTEAGEDELLATMPERELEDQYDRLNDGRVPNEPVEVSVRRTRRG